MQEQNSIREGSNEPRQVTPGDPVGLGCHWPGAAALAVALNSDL